MSARCMGRRWPAPCGRRVTGWATVPAGESSKNLEQLSRLVEEGLRFGLDRQGVVLALGGGVVGDLAGFLAASYMRGIPFVELPTTLLAHDSSVGGKVGVNHPLGKNVIGAFHQPLMVVFDVDTLRSLPRREVISGYAEVVKHALIADDSFADWLLQNSERLLQLEPSLVEEAIWGTVAGSRRKWCQRMRGRRVSGRFSITDTRSDTLWRRLRDMPG